MSGERFPIPSGTLSARIHGAGNALRQWAATAAEASQAPGISPEFAAALRGKRAAYLEAEALLRSIERGWRLPRLWRFVGGAR